MFDVVLVHPEIPPNAGNAIRLCANTGCRLHLVEPLGFSMDDKQLKRAGLDYHELSSVTVHRDWPTVKALLGDRRFFAFTTKASTRFTEAKFRANDVFVFGSETAGLPASILGSFSVENQLKLPMLPGNRSINLSNAVAVVVYEAWRQIGFSGAAR
jgi:tRNA (cytidine/uridine-2'-O-)-methyltransferase